MKTFVEQPTQQYQRNYRSIPTTQPLKSPSPDFKNKSIMFPTSSPDNYHLKKTFQQTTPHNRSSTNRQNRELNSRQFNNFHSSQNYNNHQTTEKKTPSSTPNSINHYASNLKYYNSNKKDNVNNQILHNGYDDIDDRRANKSNNRRYQNQQQLQKIKQQQQQQQKYFSSTTTGYRHKPQPQSRQPHNDAEYNKFSGINLNFSNITKNPYFQHNQLDRPPNSPSIVQYCQPQQQNQQYPSNTPNPHHHQRSQSYHHPLQINNPYQSSQNSSNRQYCRYCNNQSHSQSQSQSQSQSLYLLQQQIHQKQKALNQKQTIITQLKSIIQMLTENGKQLKRSNSSCMEQNYEGLKNQVKILTIENQKLVEVIDRFKDKTYTKALLKNATTNNNMNKKDDDNSNSDDNNINHTLSNNLSRQSNVTQPIIKSFHVSNIKEQRQRQRQCFQQQQQQQKQRFNKQAQQQIKQLRKQLNQKQKFYENQIDQLIKSHKSLALQCKFYESEKEKFWKENQHLMKLLKLKQQEKQASYAGYSYTGAVAASSSPPTDNNQPTNKPSNSSPTTYQQKSSTMPSDKLSLQKIKQQYQQSLKQYKQNVYNQVENMFETISSALQQINGKVNILDSRIVEMEQLKQELVKRIQQRHKSSSHIQSQFSDIDDNEQIKKSAIYIEDGSSSDRLSALQSDRRQKGALSVIIETSRKDNEKLQMELSKVKRELEYYRQKVEAQADLYKKADTGIRNFNEEQYSSRIQQLEYTIEELTLQKQKQTNQLNQLQRQIMKKSALLLQNQSPSSSSNPNPSPSKNNTPASNYHSSIQKPQLKISESRIEVQYCDNDLKAEIENLEAQLQECVLEKNQIAEQNKKIEDALQRRQSQLMEDIEQLQKLIDQTQSRNREQISDWNRQRAEQANRHLKQMEYLRSIITQLQQNVLTVQKQNQNIRNQHQTQLSEFIKTNDAKKQKQLQEQIAKSQQQQSKQFELFHAKELQNQRSCYEQQIQQLKQANSQIKQELQRLKESSRKAQEDKAEIFQTVRNLQKIAIGQQQQDNEQPIIMQQTQIQSILKYFEKLQNQKNQIQQQLQRNNNIMKEKITLIETLNKESVNKQEQIFSLKKQLCQVKEKVSRLEQQNRLQSIQLQERKQMYERILDEKHSFDLLHLSKREDHEDGQKTINQGAVAQGQSKILSSNLNFKHSHQSNKKRSTDRAIIAQKLQELVNKQKQKFNKMMHLIEDLQSKQRLSKSSRPRDIIKTSPNC